MLIQMLSSKARKGKNAACIAAEIEQEEEQIRPLYELVISMPEATAEEILQAYRKKDRQDK